MSIVMSSPVTKPFDRRWLVLGIVVAAQFIFVVDAFIVNVAIPSIRASLDATTGEIQGVIVLYQIAFASLIIVGGRLGDIRGPKPVFLCGLVGFTAASFWCGLAHSGRELVVARAAQGAAAAMMIPQVLATIHVLFPDAARGRAFGVFGFTLGFGAAVGFGLGGWLVALDLGGLAWRTIFFVNVPIGVALTCAALHFMPPVPGKTRSSLDVAGAVLLFVALLCLVGPLLLGPDLAWAPWLFAVMATGAILLVLMWRLERWVERRDRLPLIHLDLLCDRSFANGLLAVFSFTFANMSFYLVMTLYMQLGLGFSPLTSGSVILPLAIAFAVMSRVAGPRAQRRGVRALIEGCLVQIGGLTILGAAVAVFHGLAAPVLALLLVVFGVGQAMVMAPLYACVLAKVPTSHAGSGGGVVSTVQQIGNGCGVAVIGTLYYGCQATGTAREALIACIATLIFALVLTAGFLRSMDRTPRRRAPVLEHEAKDVRR
jgi:EmrB/QacA subfamily drug resistance transporter